MDAFGNGGRLEEEWEQVSFRFDKFFVFCTVFNNVYQISVWEKSEFSFNLTV